MRVSRVDAGRLFGKALIRKAETPDLPEAKLCMAVIAQAFFDALRHNADAQRFFHDDRMDGYAEAIGARPGDVRDMVLRATTAVDRGVARPA